MAVVVARIGKAHGLRGEVTVRVHTDTPDERFVVGARFETEPASAGPLTLRSVRDHNGILLLGFEEASDRTGAEGLRGTRLLAAEEADAEDAWYEDDLVGLAVVDVHGHSLGEVTGLESRPAQDLLVLRLADGRTARVPFVAQLVPEVDVDGGRVVVDPPEGLLDLDEG
ncbi:ribosome maturation factor RimM [Segeticoccus rhizosphaerae]|uniref:ribosome maturation factor RimM n=1 Tax=Segeticoccus rhizosphaerae TaxID=1104777 RepID=UPI0010BF8785|nr:MULTISPECIES: ribosome maturation factor RimM [Intrasporangiaceae]